MTNPLLGGPDDAAGEVRAYWLGFSTGILAAAMGLLLLLTALRYSAGVG
jgi:hypothetical protein